MRSYPQSINFELLLRSMAGVVSKVCSSPGIICTLQNPENLWMCLKLVANLNNSCKYNSYDLCNTEHSILRMALAKLLWSNGDFKNSWQFHSWDYLRKLFMSFWVHFHIFCLIFWLMIWGSFQNLKRMCESEFLWHLDGLHFHSIFPIP